MNIRSKQSIPVICNQRYALPGKTEELKCYKVYEKPRRACCFETEAFFGDT
jgi:hypothetical protein